MTPSWYKWAVLTIGTLAGFTFALDSSMVGFSIAHLCQVFDADVGDTQWVITGFLLAAGMVVPSCGYLADRFGIKRVFLAGFALFTIFAAASGSATNLNALIVFRVVQGIGGGLFIPLGLAMIFRVVAHEERGKFLGILLGVSLIAPALGPVLGGYLVEYASWRWVFLLQVPIGVLAIILTLAWFREQKLPAWGGFDLPGLMLSAAGFGLLLYALSEAPDRGWGDPLKSHYFSPRW